MTKSQYATIPIELLDIKKNKKGISNKLQLSKITPYKSFKLNNIVIKIGNEKTPYVEELITKNKIGLNKKDEYKIYIPGDIIYCLCTKKQAYKTVTELNYQRKIVNLFTKNS